jgi:hypothetical protein
MEAIFVIMGEAHPVSADPMELRPMENQAEVEKLVT